MNKKVLLVGESWESSATHVKGFDQFYSTTFHTGSTYFIDALRDTNYDVTYMCAHQAAKEFPLSLEDMHKWDVIILSDIGANTLLLHPDTWLKSKRTANRLTLIHDYVAGGGSLMMIGGYFSFQGINGAARYHRTPVEKVLPVQCLPYDDRVEAPEGHHVEIVNGDDPILNGINGDWPWLLGYNEVTLHPEAKLLATLAETGLPLLATREYQQGKTLAWTSDMAEHWLPEEFCNWEGYRQLWLNCLDWLTGETYGD
ncbi:glutamine amidotransferase [Psychromonas sp.]|uniref:glutamine amidotransferase n=1 Tax=Psychromonas sp. TaxID=1884585 RepID=UPI003A97B709